MPRDKNADAFHRGSVTQIDRSLIDVDRTYQARRTVSASATLAATDIGYEIVVDTDAQVITLPATVVGYAFTIVNGGVDGAVLVAISPNASDKIAGPGITAADDKDLLNTKATAKKGDYVKLIGDGANGWMVTEMRGTWAREA